MSTKQPKALTLAAELRTGNWAPNILQNEAALRDRAADEMERLHAENETLHVENDTLRAGYDAARLEIESLQAQAQAQALALEAQLEAVGAVPDGMTHREFGQFLSDVLTAAGLVSHGGQSKGLGQRLADAVMRLHAAPQPAAQALDSVRVFWQQHTQADALSMTMAELHNDAERVIRAAPQPAAQAQEDAPDMFWDADDTENFAHEVQDIVDGYCSGEIVTIECAKRMPSLRVLITGEGENLAYEHIDAAIEAQKGDAA